MYVPRFRGFAEITFTFILATEWVQMTTRRRQKFLRDRHRPPIQPAPADGGRDFASSLHVFGVTSSESGAYHFLPVGLGTLFL